MSEKEEFIKKFIEERDRLTRNEVLDKVLTSDERYRVFTDIANGEEVKLTVQQLDAIIGEAWERGKHS